MDKKKSSSVSSPERGTTGGKSSKGKKTKAKEEEERRLEEESRLKAEQDEKERKEREKIIAEENRKREIQIIELKLRELGPFYDIINEICLKASNHYLKQKELFKWNRYMLCDGSPDPSDAREINTFLSLWRDDQESYKFKDSLQNIDLALKLIDELSNLIQSNNTENSETERYKNVMNELEQMITKKTDEISYDLLLKANDEIDLETLNFNFSDGNQNTFYCLWANLSHNQKTKDFSFGNKSFSFSLPRLLTLSHVVVCCIFTNFDFYSNKSRTFNCRVNADEFDFDALPVIASQPKEIEDNLDKDNNLNDESKEIIEDVELLKTENSNSDKITEIEPVKVEIEIENKIETPKKIVLPDELAILQELSDNFVIDLRNYLPLGEIFKVSLYEIPPQPKKIKQLTITQKENTSELKMFHYPTLEPNLAHISWLEYWNKKQEQEHLSLNHGEQEELAETTKSNMNLTLRSNDPLESTIGTETFTSESNKQFFKSLQTKSNEQLVKSMKNEGPLQINYKISPKLYFGETPVLARWDHKKQHWRTDEILDYKYIEESNEIQFKTYHFSPFCLLQDRHVHMPFQLWRMAPRELPNNCIFTLETTNFELNIEIKEDQLRVYVPIKTVVEEDLTNKTHKKSSSTATNKSREKSEGPVSRLDYQTQNSNPKLSKIIEPIANVWFNLRKFKEALKSIGLNIFPEPDSEKFVTITNKNKKLEWFAYKNMALCSSLVSFAYSRWNAEINDDSKIVILQQIHLTNKEPNPDLYKCLLCTQDFFLISSSTEGSDEFNQRCHEGTKEHADLYHMCVEEFSKEVDASVLDSRVKQIDPIFYQTCFEFLESIKILTYS